MSDPFIQVFRALGRVLRWYASDSYRAHRINRVVMAAVHNYQEVKDDRARRILSTDNHARAAVGAISGEVNAESIASLNDLLQITRTHLPGPPRLDNEVVSFLASKIDDEQLRVIGRATEALVVNPEVESMVEQLRESEIVAKRSENPSTATGLDARYKFLIVFIFWFYISIMLTVEVTSPGWEDELGDWEQHLEVAVLAAQGTLLASLLRKDEK